MSVIDVVPRARLTGPSLPRTVVVPLIAVFALLAWVAFFLFLRANESRIVFMTDRTHGSLIPFDGMAVHRVQVATTDGLSLEGIQLESTEVFR